MLKGISKIFPKRLKVLFVASEAAPFAKAGGLGDVIFSLPLALRKLGVDARVMIPRYGKISSEYKMDIVVKNLKVPTDQEFGSYPYLICNVKQYLGSKAVPSYFLENMEYYEKRANVYGYSDDAIRWALLSRGVLEFIKNYSWQPDIIAASDWQTGLIPNYLKTVYKNDSRLSKIRTIFSIHNLHYQGMCDYRFMAETERDSGHEAIPDFFSPRLAKINWMLRGIMYADLITTVSPTYAQEILTPEYGEGLERILSERRGELYGILNGLDYNYYDPQQTPYIPFHYNFRMIDRREKNKSYLQKRFGLKQDKSAFLVAMASRFSEQKGFDLIEKIIEPLLDNIKIQFAFLGDGETRYKEFIKKAAEKYPKKVSYVFEFSAVLPHLIFSGADAILVPSRFEPCGIVQMQAFRYGAIPIVRNTGGLADTVENFSLERNEGDGFVFEKYNPDSLLTAIVRAATIFEIKDKWKGLIKRAMQKDFSWQNSAKEYLRLFYIALKEKQI